MSNGSVASTDHRRDSHETSCELPTQPRAQPLHRLGSQYQAAPLMDPLTELDASTPNGAHQQPPDGLHDGHYTGAEDGDPETNRWGLCPLGSRVVPPGALHRQHLLTD